MAAPHESGVSFAAIDFETATAQRFSACALGVAVVDAGHIVDEQSWLIQPPDNEYDGFNSRLHGISAADTKDAPPFCDVWAQAVALIGDRVLVAHNAPFDVSVIRHSAIFHDYTPPEASFVCTYRLARSRWPDLGSWRLPDVCDALGISGLNHHDPLSDARAAARVLLTMCELDSSGVIEVCETLSYRIGLLSTYRYASFSNAARRSSSSSRPSTRVSDIEPTVDAIDPDGPLFGKRVAFTGTLDSMTREAAFQVTVNSGGAPTNSVSKKTDYLVLGMTDYTKVSTGGMSSKMRKAAELADSGAMIEIINEDDFLRLATFEAFNPLDGTIKTSDLGTTPRFDGSTTSDAIDQDAKRGKEESGRLVVPEWHPRPTSIEQLLTDTMGADATTAMKRVFTHVAGPEEAELLASDAMADVATALAEFIAEDVEFAAEGADDALQAATETVEEIVSEMKAPVDTLVADVVADTITFVLADTGAENAAAEIAHAAIAAMSKAMEAATAKEGRGIVDEILNGLSQRTPSRSQQTWILGSAEL